MKRSILFTVAVMTMTGALGATAWADQTAVPQTVKEPVGALMLHRVLSITPYWVEDINGKRTRHLMGADIRIEAEPGMTAEYLTVELRRALAAAGGSESLRQSVFGVEGSTVEVRSVGDGFVFRVTATDNKHAEEIVRRARLFG